MTTPLQQAAQAMIDRWESPDWKDTPHTAHYIAELRKALDAELAQSVEPVAYWIPKAEQFCLPPKDGTRPFAKAWNPLYLHPPQPQATTPAVSNDWLIRKEPNTKDKYYVAEGKPPANVLEIYEITGEKP